MVLKNNKLQKLEKAADRRQHFGIRKLTIGAASVLLGTTLWLGRDGVNVEAADQGNDSKNGSNDADQETESKVDTPKIDDKTQVKVQAQPSAGEIKTPSEGTISASSSQADANIKADAGTQENIEQKQNNTTTNAANEKTNSQKNAQLTPSQRANAALNKAAAINQKTANEKQAGKFVADAAAQEVEQTVSGSSQNDSHVQNVNLNKLDLSQSTSQAGLTTDSNLGAQNFLANLLATKQNSSNKDAVLQTNTADSKNVNSNSDSSSLISGADSAADSGKVADNSNPKQVVVEKASQDKAADTLSQGDAALKKTAAIINAGTEAGYQSFTLGKQSFVTPDELNQLGVSLATYPNGGGDLSKTSDGLWQYKAKDGVIFTDDSQYPFKSNATLQNTIGQDKYIFWAGSFSQASGYHLLLATDRDYNPTTSSKAGQNVYWYYVDDSGAIKNHGEFKNSSGMAGVTNASGTVGNYDQLDFYKDPKNNETTQSGVSLSQVISNPGQSKNQILVSYGSGHKQSDASSTDVGDNFGMYTSTTTDINVVYVDENGNKIKVDQDGSEIKVAGNNDSNAKDEITDYGMDREHYNVHAIDHPTLDGYTRIGVMGDSGITYNDHSKISTAAWNEWGKYAGNGQPGTLTGETGILDARKDGFTYVTGGTATDLYVHHVLGDYGNETIDWYDLTQSANRIADSKTVNAKDSEQTPFSNGAKMTIPVAHPHDTVVVFYEKAASQTETAKIKYVDDDNNQAEITGTSEANNADQSVTGQSNATINFSDASSTVNSILGKHYVYNGTDDGTTSIGSAEDGFTNVKWPTFGSKSHEIVVHFKHGTQNVNNTKSVTRTINYLEEGTNTQLIDPDTETVTFSENGTHDLVDSSKDNITWTYTTSDDSTSHTGSTYTFGQTGEKASITTSGGKTYDYLYADKDDAGNGVIKAYTVDATKNPQDRTINVYYSLHQETNDYESVTLTRTIQRNIDYVENVNKYKDTDSNFKPNDPNIMPDFSSHLDNPTKVETITLIGTGYINKKTGQLVKVDNSILNSTGNLTDAVEKDSSGKDIQGSLTWTASAQKFNGFNDPKSIEGNYTSETGTIDSTTGKFIPASPKTAVPEEDIDSIKTNIPSIVLNGTTITNPTVGQYLQYLNKNSGSLTNLSSDLVEDCSNYPSRLNKQLSNMDSSLAPGGNHYIFDQYDVVFKNNNGSYNHTDRITLSVDRNDPSNGIVYMLVTSPDYTQERSWLVYNNRSDGLIFNYNPSGNNNILGVQIYESIDGKSITVKVPDDANYSLQHIFGYGASGSDTSEDTAWGDLKPTAITQKINYVYKAADGSIKEVPGIVADQVKGLTGQTFNLSGINTSDFADYKFDHAQLDNGQTFNPSDGRLSGTLSDYRKGQIYTLSYLDTVGRVITENFYMKDDKGTMTVTGSVGDSTMQFYLPDGTDTVDQIDIPAGETVYAKDPGYSDSSFTIANPYVESTSNIQVFYTKNPNNTIIPDPTYVVYTPVEEKGSVTVNVHDDTDNVYLHNTDYDLTTGQENAGTAVNYPLTTVENDLTNRGYQIVGTPTIPTEIVAKQNSTVTIHVIHKYRQVTSTNPVDSTHPVDPDHSTNPVNNDPTPGLTKDDLQKTVKRTINYIFADGTTAASHSITQGPQSVSFEGTAYIDETNGKLITVDPATNTVTDWNKGSISWTPTSGDMAAINKKDVDGYHVVSSISSDDNKSVAKQDGSVSDISVSKDTPDIAVTIVYAQTPAATPDKAQVEFIDEDESNKVLTTLKNDNGSKNENISFDGQDQTLQSYLNAGYVFDKAVNAGTDNKDTTNSIATKNGDAITFNYPKFDGTPDNVQYFKIYLKHGTTTQTEKDTTTAYVHYEVLGNDTNKPKAPEDSTKQTINWTKTDTVDSVTNQVTKEGNWTPDKTSFSSVTSPTVDGYTPSQTSVSFATPVRGQDQVVIVVYSKNAPAIDSANIKVVDEDDNNAVLAHNAIQGANGTTIGFDGMSDTVQNYLNSGYVWDYVNEGNTKLAAKKYAEINFGNFDKNNKNQSWTIYLRHGTTHVDHEHPGNGYSADDLQKTVTTNISYVDEKGNEISGLDPISHTVTFSGQGDYDNVTKQWVTVDSNGKIMGSTTGLTWTFTVDKKPAQSGNSTTLDALGAQNPSGYTYAYTSGSWDSKLSVNTTDGSVAQQTVTPSTANSNIIVHFNKIPTAQANIVVTYHDDTTNTDLKTDTEKPQDVGSNITYSTQPSIDNYKKQGYKLVSNVTIPSTMPENGFTGTVHLAHDTTPINPDHPGAGYSKSDLQRTITRTVNYIDQDGNSLGVDPVTETVNFTGKGTVDNVTGKLVTTDNSGKITDWTKGSINWTYTVTPGNKTGHTDSYEFTSLSQKPTITYDGSEYDFNHVDQKAYDDQAVNGKGALKSYTVTHASPNLTINVVYSKKPAAPATQKAEVIYRDLDNNDSVLDHDDSSTNGGLQGTAGQVINYDPTVKINNLEDKGYVLVNNGFAKGTAFDSTADTTTPSQIFYIDFRHGTRTVDHDHPADPNKPVDPNHSNNPTTPKNTNLSAKDLQKAVTRTINYVIDNTDKTVLKTPVTQTITFNGKGTIDLVTGNLVDLNDNGTIKDQTGKLQWTYVTSSGKTGTGESTSFDTIDAVPSLTYDNKNYKYEKVDPDSASGDNGAVKSQSVSDQDQNKIVTVYYKAVQTTYHTINPESRTVTRTINYYDQVTGNKIPSNLINTNPITQTATLTRAQIVDDQGQVIGYGTVDPSDNTKYTLTTVNDGWTISGNWAEAKSPDLSDHGYTAPTIATVSAKTVDDKTTDTVVNVYYGHDTVVVPPTNPGHGLTATDLNKTVTRTINYQDNNGNAVNGSPDGKSTFVQTATFTRTAIVDKTNDKLLGYDTNGDGKVDVLPAAGDYAWTASNNSNQFASVASKDPSDVGYNHVDIKNVSAITVGPKSDDSTVTVTYSKDAQQGSLQIHYIDEDDNNAVLHSDSESGKYGDSVNYDPTAEIKTLTDQGYIEDTKYNKADKYVAQTSINENNNGKIFIIAFKHGTKQGTTEIIVPTETIHFRYADGTTAAPDVQGNAGSFKFTRTSTVDAVTGHVINPGTWNEESYTFNDGTKNVKVINGYVADKATYGNKTATPTDKDVEDVVIYRKISNIIPVDQNGNQIPGTTTVTYTNDPNDPTKVTPNENSPRVPSGWTISTTGQPNGVTPNTTNNTATVTPVDPTKPTKVVYTEDSEKATLHIIDINDGNKELNQIQASGQDNSGITFNNAQTTIDEWLNKGYKVNSIEQATTDPDKPISYSNDYAKASSTWTFDDKPGVDQQFYVYLEHDYTPINPENTYGRTDLTRKVKETVHYVDEATNKPVATDYTNTLTFTGQGMVDKVTHKMLAVKSVVNGQITYDNDLSKEIDISKAKDSDFVWSNATTFAKVTSPTITGYTIDADKTDQSNLADGGNIKEINNVTYDHRDVVATVYYKANPVHTQEAATLTIIDDTTGGQLADYSVTGQDGAAISFKDNQGKSANSQIANYLRHGYDWEKSSDNSLTAASYNNFDYGKLDNDPQTNQSWTIYLVHKTKQLTLTDKYGNESLDKKITRNVKYQYDDGTQAANPVNQTVEFNGQGYIDQVTGQLVQDDGQGHVKKNADGSIASGQITWKLVNQDSQAVTNGTDKATFTQIDKPTVDQNSSVVKITSSGDVTYSVNNDGSVDAQNLTHQNNDSNVLIVYHKGTVAEHHTAELTIYANDKQVGQATATGDKGTDISFANAGSIVQAFEDNGFTFDHAEDVSNNTQIAGTNYNDIQFGKYLTSNNSDQKFAIYLTKASVENSGLKIVDDTQNRTLANYGQSGKTGDAIKFADGVAQLQYYLNNGYAWSKADKNGTALTDLTKDNCSTYDFGKYQDNENPVWTIHLVHQIVPVDHKHPGNGYGSDQLTKTITTKVSYVDQDGNAIEGLSPINNTVTFNGSGYYDAVTKQWTDKNGKALTDQSKGITWTNTSSTPDGDSVIFTKINAQHPEGYTYTGITGNQDPKLVVHDNDGSIDAQTVTPTTADSNLVVHFAKKQGTIEVIYHDNTSDVDLTGYGQTTTKQNEGTSFAYDPNAKDLPALEKLHYVVDGQLPTMPTKYTDGDQRIVIYVKHGTQDVPVTQKVTRDFIYVFSDGTQAKDHTTTDGQPVSEAAQTATFNGHKTVDLVTGKTVTVDEDGKITGLGGPVWDENSAELPTVAAKTVEGYHVVSTRNAHVDGSVGEVTVTPDSEDIHVRITYAPDEYNAETVVGKQTVHYVDGDDNDAKLLDDNVNSTFTFTKDSKTGQWNAESHQYENANAPVINGYVAEHKTYDGQMATPTDPDKEITIIYHKISNIVPVDKNGKKIPNQPTPTYVNDPKDPTKVVPNEPTPNIPGWHITNNPNPGKTPDGKTDDHTVTPSDPTKPTNVTYEQDGTTLKNQKTVTASQKVEYQDDKGNTLGPEKDQNFTFTYSGDTYDAVTNTLIKKGTWNVESHNFGSENVPVIAGYTLSIGFTKNGNGYTAGGFTTDPNASHKDRNRTFIVVYTKTPNKPVATAGSITYYDDTDNRSLESASFNGNAGDKINYTTADRVSYYEGLGYDLVSNNFSDGKQIFDKDANKNVFAVHLKHATVPITPQNPGKPGDPVPKDPKNPNEPDHKYPDSYQPQTLTKDVTRTVSYVFTDGKRSLDPVKKTIEFTGQGTLDLVTGHLVTVNGDHIDQNGSIQWNKNNGQFAAIPAIDMTGYYISSVKNTNSQATVDSNTGAVSGETVTPTSNDINIVITLKPNPVTPPAHTTQTAALTIHDAIANTDLGSATVQGPDGNAIDFGQTPAERISYYLSHGYKWENATYNGTDLKVDGIDQITFGNFDKNDDSKGASQAWVINLVHQIIPVDHKNPGNGYSPDQLTKTITTNVSYVDQNGKAIAGLNPVNNSVTFNGSGYYDAVTKQWTDQNGKVLDDQSKGITWTNNSSTPNGDSATFAKINAQKPNGYTYAGVTGTKDPQLVIHNDDGSIDAQTVTPTSTDSKIVIHFNENPKPVVRNQNAGLRIVDQDDNNAVLNTYNGAGKAAESISFNGYSSDVIENYIKQGYVVIGLTNDNISSVDATMTGTDPTKWNFGKYDDKDDITQNFTITLKHGTEDITPNTPDPDRGYTKDSLTRTGTQTVHYIITGSDADKPADPADHTANVTFTHSLTIDRVTGKVIKDNGWTPGSGTYEAVNSPEVSGYTPDTATVAKKTVTIDPKTGNGNIDDYEVVVYTKTPVAQAHIIITYHDDTTNSDLKIDTEPNQDVGTNITYSTHPSISDFEKQGYKLVSDVTIPTTMPQNGFTGVVHLAHTYSPVDHDDPHDGIDKSQYEKDVTSTIHYVYSDGTKAHDDNVQKATWTRTLTIDNVTGQIVPNGEDDKPWTANKKTYDAVNSPTIDGYHPDKIMVPAKTVTQNDLEETVIYVKNGTTLKNQQTVTASQTVEYQDDQGNTLSPSKTQNFTFTYTGDTYDANTNKLISKGKWNAVNHNFTAENVPVIDGYVAVSGFVKNGNSYNAGGFATDHDASDAQRNRTFIVIYKKISNIVPITPDRKPVPDPNHPGSNVPNKPYINDPKDPTKVVNEQVPTIPGYKPNTSTVTPVDPTKPTKVTYTKNPVTETGTVTITVHDNTTGQDLTQYGYSSDKDGKPQQVGTVVDYNKTQTITDLINHGYKVINPDVSIPTTVTKGNTPVVIYVEHTTTTVTPDRPGTPGQPIDPTNPNGPKYPTGTDLDQLKKTGTQTIHYTGAGNQTPADNTQSFTFTRQITFDNVTGKIINTTPWNVSSHTFDNVATPVINGYHADKGVVDGSTVTPDDLSKTVTVTYNANGHIIPVDQNGNPIPGADQPVLPTDPNDPTKVVNGQVPAVPGYEPVNGKPGDPVSPDATNPGLDVKVPYKQNSQPSEPDVPINPTVPQQPTNAPTQPTKASQPTTAPTTPTQPIPDEPDEPVGPDTPDEPDHPATSHRVHRDTGNKTPRPQGYSYNNMPHGEYSYGYNYNNKPIGQTLPNGDRVLTNGEVVDASGNVVGYMDASGHIHYNESNKSVLPQTGESSNENIADAIAGGLAVSIGLIGLAGVRKKRRD